MTIRRMRIACWITRATNTHSEYVTLIDFPLQQWLHERVSMLRYTYTVCLVLYMYPFHTEQFRISIVNFLCKSLPFCYAYLAILHGIQPVHFCVLLHATQQIKLRPLKNNLRVYTKRVQVKVKVTL